MSKQPRVETASNAVPAALCRDVGADSNAIDAGAAEECCGDFFDKIDAAVRPEQRIDDIIYARDRTVGVDLLAALEDNGILNSVKSGKWADGLCNWASISAMGNMIVVSPAFDLSTGHSENTYYIPAPLSLDFDFSREVSRVAQYVDSIVEALMCVSVDPERRALRFSVYVDTENFWGNQSVIWKDRSMPVLNFLDFEWVEGEGWRMRGESGFRNFIIPGRMIPHARDLSFFEAPPQLDQVPLPGEDYLERLRSRRCWQRDGGQHYLSQEQLPEMPEEKRRDWFSRQLLFCQV
jgi:hypothetical protein